MNIDSSLKKLRLKYYWKGVVLHDVVSLVGENNILYTSNLLQSTLKVHNEDFYHVSRQSITNGRMNYSSTPTHSKCSQYHFDTYKLDSRCIVISGDTHKFKAMIIRDDSTIPILLGRESFAIRFNTPEDAIAAHAWFLSDEVSSAIRSTLREKSLNMNKSSMRITIDEIKALPVPSVEWLNNSYSHGALKAKCIGLGSHIISSLQGGDVNDPMYRDIVSILESTAERVGFNAVQKGRNHTA